MIAMLSLVSPTRAAMRGQDARGDVVGVTLAVACPSLHSGESRDECECRVRSFLHESPVSLSCFSAACRSDWGPAAQSSGANVSDGSKFSRSANPRAIKPCDTDTAACIGSSYCNSPVSCSHPSYLQAFPDFLLLPFLPLSQRASLGARGFDVGIGAEEMPSESEMNQIFVRYSTIFNCMCVYHH